MAMYMYIHVHAVAEDRDRDRDRGVDRPDDTHLRGRFAQLGAVKLLEAPSPGLPAAAAEPPPRLPIAPVGDLTCASAAWWRWWCS